MTRSPPLARYVVQFWRQHFINCDWVQALEDAAIADLNERTLNPNEYWPESWLGEIRCRVRPLTPQEIKSNGRNFAGRTHACLEFSLLQVNRSALLAAVSKDQIAVQAYGLEDLCNLWMAVELERFCEILNYVVAITYAGALRLDDSKVVIGRQSVSYSNKTIVGIERSGEEYSFFSSGVAPRLTLDEVLQWSKKCNGIWNGLAATSVEKAVSLLSHTFNSQESRSEVATLLWATAGLEAVACDSSNSVGAQLKRRLPMLCDIMPFKNIEKLVSEAYGFRSRLFHGDIPIINCFNEDEVGYHSGRYDAKVYRYGLTLQLMLIAVVWKAIIANSVNLTFNESPKFS